MSIRRGRIDVTIARSFAGRVLVNLAWDGREASPKARQFDHPNFPSWMKATIAFYPALVSNATAGTPGERAVRKNVPRFSLLAKVVELIRHTQVQEKGTYQSFEESWKSIEGELDDVLLKLGPPPGFWSDYENGDCWGDRSK